MRATVKSSGNCLGIAIALVMLALGIIITALGLWFIGIPVCICSLFIGGKRQRVWQCVNCRTLVPRG